MFTKHVIKQLSAFCNGELAAEQTQRVREHLVVCQRCRKEYDEIKLGVNLAQKLPLVSAPAEMWSEIEALLDERSRRPVFEPKAPKQLFAFSWYRVGAFAAVLLVAVVIGVMWSSYYGPRASWEVANLAGNVRVDGDDVINIGSLGVGETIETGSSSKARITVARIGEVVMDPNTRLRLLRTRVTEHRLALDHGRIHAKISAPPRLFFVNTPSAEAIDLGCEYTLEVDEAGRGLLHVTLGEVALVLRRPANADVVAEHPTVTLHLPREEFLDLIKAHPEVLAELYELAVKRDEETRSLLAQEAADADEFVLL